MIMVDSDISFHVEVIRVGTKRSFQKDERRTRICSLTTGKLKVLLDSVEFAIGPNGMFKIRPGSVCLVENRLYLTRRCTSRPSTPSSAVGRHVVGRLL